MWDAAALQLLCHPALARLARMDICTPSPMPAPPPLSSICPTNPLESTSWSFATDMDGPPLVVAGMANSSIRLPSAPGQACPDVVVFQPYEKQPLLRILKSAARLCAGRRLAHESYTTQRQIAQSMRSCSLCVHATLSAPYTVTCASAWAIFCLWCFVPGFVNWWCVAGASARLLLSMLPVFTRSTAPTPCTPRPMKLFGSASPFIHRRTDDASSERRACRRVPCMSLRCCVA